MLILTRRTSEKVMIGEDITIEILGVRGNQIRIGIAAPKDVAVHRNEVYQRIKEEEKRALAYAQKQPKPEEALEL